MTKDWNVVQEEIKELSFSQKKPLEEVKELMERKYKFRASTRAYRTKLKEWGLMRYRRHQIAQDRSVAEELEPPRHEEDSGERNPDTIVELTLVEVAHPTRSRCARPSDTDQSTASSLEPTSVSLMDMSLPETSNEHQTTDSSIILAMLKVVLEDDSQQLGKLLLKNPNRINNPIGLPFEVCNGCFYGHPAIKDVILLQHPGQTLLDIACGRPSGPVIWTLMMYDAQGSNHPLGTDLALHNAIRNNRQYTVQALLMHNRSHVDGLPGTKWKPLLQAVFWTWPDIVRVLLDRGANVDISEPDFNGESDSTALKQCLGYREKYYVVRTPKAQCNEILKMLLDAGAKLSLPDTLLSSFEMFIKPWQGKPYWFTEPGLSTTELDCMRLFVEKGADIRVPFSNYPCTCSSSNTFVHQVLWHSTPSVARLLVDSVPYGPGPSGAALLYEILGSCPDAKRHPEDILRDIGVLVERGAELNSLDSDGRTPLIRCIEHCTEVDLVPCLKKLIDGGADPELAGLHGVQPYEIAARKVNNTILLDVMQIFVSHMRGQHVRIVEGNSHSWHQGHFPVPDDLTYAQLEACTQGTSEFMLDVQNMVPEDVRPAFQQAYFAIASRNYLTSMAKLAVSRCLNIIEVNQITHAMSMREVASLPNHKFDQQLVLLLLNSHSLSSAETLDATISPPAHAPFQLNTNASVTTSHVSNTPRRTDVDDDDDFYALSTTQIRWLDPCAKPQPGDLRKTIAAVLQFECEVCADGNLLTKKEVEKHWVEHMHSAMCLEMSCRRRFCR